MDRNEMIADVFEALELIKKWGPVYVALLKTTGNKKDALEALKYLMNQESEAA